MMQKYVLRWGCTYGMVEGVDPKVCDGGKSVDMWSNGSLSSQR